MHYSRSIYATSLIALYFLSSTIGVAQPKPPVLAADGGQSSASAASGASCPVFSPVMTLVLSDIYSDAHGSVPDEVMVQKNKEQTDKVDAFLRYAENALDSPAARTGDAASDCAYSNFRQWAKAGALTVEPKPYNRQGKVSRGEYLIGIDVLALKFKAVGFHLDHDTMLWLHTLNEENLSFYEHASNRGNLRIWAGAAAALDALLENNSEAESFQNQVWHEAMAAINKDGTIDGEMARAHRALIYHMFSFSATLVLRSARSALGNRESAADHARLKLLADWIGNTLCDPKSIESAAHAVQEIPGVWAYRIPIGFGPDLLNANWEACGQPHAGLSDPTSGGDTKHTAQILRQLAQTARPQPAKN
jgi:hypothetical protein